LLIPSAIITAGNGGDTQPELGQAEEDEQQVHQDGRVAHHLHAAGRQPRHRSRTARPRDGYRLAQHRSNHNRDAGNLEREHDSARDEVPIGGNDFRVHQAEMGPTGALSMRI
jgi:hypothetical protein